MDTFHLILAWGGYAAAAALFGATAKFFLPLAPMNERDEPGRDEAAGIRAIYCMSFWGGSVMIALLSAILHRQIL